MKLRELLLPQAKSKIKAGDGLSEGKYKFFTCSPIQNKFYNTATYNRPSLIFGTGGNASIHYCDEPFSTSTDCLVMYGVAGANLELIYQYLHTNLYVLQAGFKGAGLQHISKDYILDIEIDLPNEEMQTNITKQFRQIDDMICYRNQQLLKYDELVKSRFIELFGDPVLNQYNWDVVTIGDIVTDVRYGTSRPATEGGKYSYLRMNNLTFDGHLDLSDLKYIDIPENEIEKCIVRKGDVLFNRTNSIELVGKTCVFDLEEDMVIAGYIIRVRLNEKVLPIVLSSYMNSTVLKEQLRSMAKGAVNQANINAQELQSIKIYLPPLDLQNEFVTFVEQTDKLKFEVKEALEKLEILKKSLMQQYFG